MPQAKRAVQVSYTIADDATKEREVRALVKPEENDHLEQLEIVTQDEEKTFIENGINIGVVPIWKWLLKE